MRALRVDKMTYAALEATLADMPPAAPPTTVPVQRMLTMTADEIRARAETLAAADRRASTGLARRARRRHVGDRRRQRARRRAADGLVAIANDGLSPTRSSDAFGG